MREQAAPPDVITPAQDEESRAQVDARVDELLAAPLSRSGAVQVALLNNRSLRATMESLGVAQADLVQAGLLQNPVIGGDLVVSSAGNGLGGGLSLSQSLLSVFLIPAKRRVAKARLQAAVLQVADAALELVRDVKVAYTEVQAAVAQRDLHRTLAQTAEVADEFSARQYEAGNIPDIDRQLFATSLDAARLELADKELDVALARERLNRLLGLWGNDVRWTLAERLADAPSSPLKLDRLESAGIEQRLDVSAARANVDAMKRAIEMRRRGLLPQVEGGIEARNEVGNDEGHEWVLGPSLSIELPLFDPGHADFARLRAYLRQAEHNLDEVAIQARSQIRAHRLALIIARRKANYVRGTVLPRHERVGARAIERYNGMLMGAYELLQLRDQKAHAYRAYVQARRDYWVSRAELERAVGGELPVGPAS